MNSLVKKLIAPALIASSLILPSSRLNAQDTQLPQQEEFGQHMNLEIGFGSPNDSDIESYYGNHFPLGVGVWVSINPKMLARGNFRYWWNKRDVYKDFGIIGGKNKLSQLNFEVSTAYLSNLSKNGAFYVGLGAQMAKTRESYTPTDEDWNEEFVSSTDYGPSIYLGAIAKDTLGKPGFYLEAGISSIQHKNQDFGSVELRGGMFF